MEKYNWYFRQKVNPTEMTNAMNAADAAIKQIILDSFSYGLITAPTVTERNTTANMSVDVNPPLKGFDENGEWVYIAPGPPINLSFSEIDLPEAGNQKYVSIAARFDRAESDPRIDGYGDPINYRLAQSYELELVEGAEALVGAAVRPNMPEGGLRLASVLLSEDTAAITDSIIDQLYVRRFALGGAAGASGSVFEINREKTGGDPEALDTYQLKFLRGERPPYIVRVIEGADPETDPPRIQFSVFTDSDNFTWTDVVTEGNLTDAMVSLTDQDYTGKLVGLETQQDVNDWLDDPDSFTESMVNLENAYAGNLSGMDTQDEVNAFVDAIPLGGPSILFISDLTALAAVDTTGFTSRAALVTNLGLWRWVAGSALNPDVYMVIDSDVEGQWVMEAASPQAVVATDDLIMVRGGRYIVDAGTQKTFNLPVSINPGYEIEVVNHGEGGFIVTTNSGQNLRDADTEYGPAQSFIESLDPYTAIRLMATDSETYTILSKNGSVDIYQDNLLWSSYTKTPFSTVSTSFVDAQEVQFRTLNAGSRILALVSIDFTGSSNPGRIAITFNGGAQDFVYQNTTFSGRGEQGIIIPQMSGVLSPGQHIVTVEIRSESGGAFAGNVCIVCHEVESGRYLGEQSFSGGSVAASTSSNFGSIAATFSGSPAIMLCGVVKGSGASTPFATIYGVNITQSNADLGGGGGLFGGQIWRPDAGSAQWQTVSMLNLVKPGGGGYPASGENIGMRIAAGGGSSMSSIEGKTYAIALPSSDVTDFQTSAIVAGSPTGTTWVTVRELDVTLSEQSDLYIVGHASYSGHTGGRPRARLLADGVDVTGTIQFSSGTASGSVHLAALVDGIPAGARTIELQISLASAGTYTANTAGIMAYRVRDV